MMPATGVLRARADVGGRARDGARDGDAADHRRHDVGQPCAISSTLELCRSPVMPSATTAESRLSTAASSATVNAEGSSGRIRSARNAGRANAGRPVGIPPKRVPMVSTGR